MSSTEYDRRTSIPLGVITEHQAEELWEFIESSCQSHVKVRQNPKCYRNKAPCECHVDEIKVKCLSPNRGAHAFCFEESDAIAVKLYAEANLRKGEFFSSLDLIWTDIWDTERSEMFVLTSKRVWTFGEKPDPDPVVVRR